MVSRKSRAFVRLLAACFCVSAFAMFAFAQEDPDPNSPVPVLLSLSGSTRALAVPRKGFAKVDLTRVEPQAFSPHSKVVIYVTNLALMDGEGSNAFRVYVEDASGRSYSFPVLDIQPVPTMK